MKQKLYVLTCALLFDIMAFSQKFTMSTFSGSRTQGRTCGSIHSREFKISSKLFESIHLCR